MSSKQNNSGKVLGRGAEAVIELTTKSIVRKSRPVKSYRLPQLDLQLRKIRTRTEGKILRTLHENGIVVPTVTNVDDKLMYVDMEYVRGKKLRDILNTKNAREFCKQLGTILARMHNLDVIHSDLTTSNMIVRDDTIILIDFGLSYFSKRTEDKAVDLHLLRQALDSYHFDIAKIAFKPVIAAYQREIKDKEVLVRFAIVERRGKNKH